MRTLRSFEFCCDAHHVTASFLRLGRQLCLSPIEGFLTPWWLPLMIKSLVEQE